MERILGLGAIPLAAAAILPVALDGVLNRADISAPRVNRIISIAALAGLAVAIAGFLLRPSSWYVSQWPEESVAAVEAATRNPETRLWATDGTADWLLWRIPDLRGRIAYDVRFELYDEPTLDRIIAFKGLHGDWHSTLDGYTVVVVDDAKHVRALRGEPGARVVYRDSDIAVVRRSS